MITCPPFPWAKYDENIQWCRVCGATCHFPEGVKGSDLEKVRCEKHQRSNACAIEGCKRSTKAGVGWFGLNLWLCSTHWPLIRPRSGERRVYHRIFRIAKRYGWTDALHARYWRIWWRLIARARQRAAGEVNAVEINRMFGW